MGGKRESFELKVEMGSEKKRGKRILREEKKRRKKVEKDFFKRIMRGKRVDRMHSDWWGKGGGGRKEREAGR